MRRAQAVFRDSDRCFSLNGDNQAYSRVLTRVDSDFVKGEAACCMAYEASPQLLGNGSLIAPEAQIIDSVTLHGQVSI